MALEKPLTSNVPDFDLTSLSDFRAERRLRSRVANLGLDSRFDPDYAGDLARELAPNPPVIDVRWRRRGGPVDIYFIAEDRDEAAKAVAPVIRKLLAASSLALDFHFMEPGEADDGA
jgi:hypothetical protein